jgi:acetolactate synthase-1/2/3 large subunit
MPAIATLHEQTATFAAEGWSKVTRSPGVVVLDGPLGLPRALTGIANAAANSSPLVVIDELSGSESAETLDRHTAMARTITRATLRVDPRNLGEVLLRASALASTPPRGPVLVAVAPGADTSAHEGPATDVGGPEAGGAKHASGLLDQANRPVIVAGGGVYWARAERALHRLAEEAAVPIIMNGMGRGTLPADHQLAVSRARSFALREADLVLVAGTPLDFRLNYGRFGAARVVHICEHHTDLARHVELSGSVVGRLDRILDALADGRVATSTAAEWSARVQAEERRRRQEETAQLTDDTVPMRPTRFYGELRSWLDRDAIVVGDGGDFVSYAGRYVDSFVPGCFLDPGPFGCLGVGLGYALAARVAHPLRQIVTLLGDGAAGFSLMELETLVRHRLPVVAVVGNNGVWGLEKHHMNALFGYDAVADLNQDTRYDEIARSLGGYGELVGRPDDLPGAFDRAERAEVPALLNVLLDPADMYPRSTSLA